MAASRQKATSKKPPYVLPNNRELYFPPLEPTETSEDTVYYMKLPSDMLVETVDDAMSKGGAGDLFYVTFPSEEQDGEMEISGQKHDFTTTELPPEMHAMQCVLSTNKGNPNQVVGRVHGQIDVSRRLDKKKSPKSAPRRRPTRTPTSAAPSKRTAKEINDDVTPASAKPTAPKRARLSSGSANPRVGLRSSLSGLPSVPSGSTGLRSTVSPALSPGYASGTPRQPLVMSSMTRGFSNSRSVTPPGGPSSRATTTGRARPSPGPSPALSSAPSSPGVGNLRPRYANAKELRVNIIHILALGDITEAKLRTRLFESGPDRDSEEVLRKTLREAATTHGKAGYTLRDDKWRDVTSSFQAYSEMERSRVRKALSERASKKKTPLRSRPVPKSVPKSEPRPTMLKSEPRKSKADAKTGRSESRGSGSKSDARAGGSKSEVRGSSSRTDRGSGSKAEARGSSSKGLLSKVTRKSTNEEMVAALDSFDNRMRISSAIRSEAEYEQAREYWVPLHGLYSEVNGRLQKMRDDMDELGKRYERAGGGSEKREVEKQISAMFKKCSRMHREYVRQLPKLHREVKKTLERIQDWVDHNE